MTRPLLPRTLALLAVTALPLTAQTAKPDSAPAPIEDNSFLIEEAYNQERGIVQHINTFQHAPTGRGWAYTFTQEWPVRTQTHQLSYTVPVVRADARGATPKLGDLAVNYRWQARDTNGVLFAPRLTALLPTGDRKSGAGAGGTGVQVNLPLTLELSPRWVTHSNVGGTMIPRGETTDGDRTRLTNVTLGQSLIFLAQPTFNLMLEALYTRTDVHVTPRNTLPGRVVVDPSDEAVIVSPGVRYALNFRSGLQVVPGIALPISMRKVAGSVDAQTGVFVYLSFEHPFGHR